MLPEQKQLKLSPYSSLYDIIVPKDDDLRKIKELVDFSFVYEELKTKYCLDNGRTAIDPIEMFKYLLLKTIFPVSDIDIVKRSRVDMAFKFFLDKNPEDDVIDPSSLTKFRRQRLKDDSLLDLLINKTVEIAKEKGLLKGKSIIVDSTHTVSRYNLKTPIEALKELSKKLRKSIYAFDESIKEQFPAKIVSGTLEEEIKYCEELIKVIREKSQLSEIPIISQNLNMLAEVIEDDRESLKLSKEEEAKTGHKSADSEFFGFKSHLAMSEERIIVAATVTSGEKHDGKELKTLVDKSKNAGIEVDTVIGDGAYSEKTNIEMCKTDNIKLVSKLSKTVTHGNIKNSENFEFNKDAGMYVCKSGHLSIKKTVNGKKKREKEGTALVETYFFDVEKCKKCPNKEGCYKEGASSKSYSVTIMSHTHQEHEEFQNTEFFREKSKERYKIEAKNSELKRSHGYDVALYSGLFGMELQCALTVFTVNIKRIMKLIR